MNDFKFNSIEVEILNIARNNHYEFIKRTSNGRLFLTNDVARQEKFEVFGKTNTVDTMEIPPVLFSVVKTGTRRSINDMIDTVDESYGNTFTNLLKYINPKYCIISKNVEGMPLLAFQTSINEVGVLTISIITRNHKYDLCYIDYNTNVIDTPKISWITPTDEVEFVYPNERGDEETYKNNKMNFITYYKEVSNEIIVSYRSRYNTGGVIIGVSMTTNTVTINVYNSINNSKNIATINYINGDVFAIFQNENSKKGYAVRRYSKEIFKEILQGEFSNNKNPKNVEIENLLSAEQMLIMQGVSSVGVKWITRGSDGNLYGHFEAPYYSNVIGDYITSNENSVYIREENMFPELTDDIQYPIEELLFNINEKVYDAGIDDDKILQSNLLGLGMIGVKFLSKNSIRTVPSDKCDYCWIDDAKFDPTESLRKIISDDGFIEISVDNN